MRLRRRRSRRALRSNVMWPSVSVPVLSVNSSVMLPRSSMLTSRFTSTLRRASRRDPVERLTVTIAGQQLRREADRDREREQQRVDERPVQQRR